MKCCITTRTDFHKAEWNTVLMKALKSVHNPRRYILCHIMLYVRSIIL